MRVPLLDVGDNSPNTRCYCSKCILRSIYIWHSFHPCRCHTLRVRKVTPRPEAPFSHPSSSPPPPPSPLALCCCVRWKHGGLNQPTNSSSVFRRMVDKCKRLHWPGFLKPSPGRHGRQPPARLPPRRRHPATSACSRKALGCGCLGGEGVREARKQEIAPGDTA